MVSCTWLGSGIQREGNMGVLLCLFGWTSLVEANWQLISYSKAFGVYVSTSPGWTGNVYLWVVKLFNRGRKKAKTYRNHSGSYTVLAPHKQTRAAMNLKHHFRVAAVILVAKSLGNGLWFWPAAVLCANGYSKACLAGTLSCTNTHARAQTQKQICGKQLLLPDLEANIQEQQEGTQELSGFKVRWKTGSVIRQPLAATYNKASFQGF